MSFWLFSKLKWEVDLPAPYDQPSILKRWTNAKAISQYYGTCNSGAKPMATLHATVIRALLIARDLAQGSSKLDHCAYGKQHGDYSMAELRETAADFCQLICYNRNTGETIRRHPDTVVILTTNTDYAGCTAINQSIYSRMDLIFDVHLPTPSVLAQRVSNITGFTDLKCIEKMAVCVYSMAQFCRENVITDGICGVRELINWVQSYQVLHDIHKSAKITLLSSVSTDEENRKAAQEGCLAPIWGSAA